MSETTGQRPTLLTVLCILSFISAGLGILFGVLLLVGAAAILGSLGSIPGMSVGGGSAYLIISLILAGAQFYAVLQMWNLKKLGFFIYAGVQVASIILGAVMGTGFSAFGAAIAADRKSVV